MDSIIAAARWAPFLPVAVGLIVGILCDAYAKLTPWYFVGLLVVATAAAFVRRIRAKAAFVTVFAASMGVGGLLHYMRSRWIPADRIEQLATDEGRIVRVRGSIASPPRVYPKPKNLFSRWTYGAESTHFIMEVVGVEGPQDWVPASGRIRVVVNDPAHDLLENESIQAFGRLTHLRPARNPGTPDWASYYRRQGIGADLRCPHRRNIELLESESPRPFPRFTTWLRTKARGLLIDDVAAAAPDHAGLLQAMVLGHRSGCIHFLAASGTNVAILVGFVWFFARLLRRTKRGCAWLMVVSVLAYAFVADPRPPILRATVMVIIFCLSYLVRRRTAHLNSVALAAAVLLVWDPDSLFDIGFQLSFAAVLGVVYLSEALRESVLAAARWVEREWLKRPFAVEDRRIIRSVTAYDLRWPARLRKFGWHARRTLGMAVAVSFGAWLASAPIAAWHFQQVQSWGAPNTLVVYLLFSTSMFLGFAKLLAGGLSPTLGWILGYPLWMVDSVLFAVVEKLSHLPGASLDVPAPPVWLLVLYYAFLVVLVWTFRRARPPDDAESFQLPNAAAWQPAVSIPPRSRMAVAACAGLFVCVGLGMGVWLWPRHHNSLVMTVLAVGRGSATVLELPEGRTVLYDAGTSYPWDVGESTVVPFLRHRGIRNVDRAYVSHANLDHFSGVPSILASVPTGPVVLNPHFEGSAAKSAPARHLLELLERAGHRIEVLDPNRPRWAIGSVEFERLWPPHEPEPSLSANDLSTVLRIRWAGHSILLTGDIEAPAQRSLLEGGDLAADVLILPHHGSAPPTLPEFLNAVRPRFVIRSHFERLAQTSRRLFEILGNTPIYNTADCGAVQVIIDETGLSVSTHLIKNGIKAPTIE
jgi:competence protein ComEC